MMTFLGTKIKKKMSGTLRPYCRLIRILTIILVWLKLKEEWDLSKGWKLNSINSSKCLLMDWSLLPKRSPFKRKRELLRTNSHLRRRSKQLRLVLKRKLKLTRISQLIRKLWKRPLKLSREKRGSWKSSWNKLFPRRCTSKLPKKSQKLVESEAVSLSKSSTDQRY